jgi:hypothetical protein
MEEQERGGETAIDSNSNNSAASNLITGQDVYGGGREYWNARYAQPKFAKHKDWYCEYAILRRHAQAVFAPYLPLPAPSSVSASGCQPPRLLVVGCGNSCACSLFYFFAKLFRYFLYFYYENVWAAPWLMACCGA